MLDNNPLRTEADYEAALARITDLIHSPPDSAEEAELDRLSDLVIQYEDVHYPMEDPEPDAIIEFLLDQEIVTREQLLPLAGSDASLDAILAGQEPIPPGLAQLLYDEVGITTEALPQSAVGQATTE
jgi:HTH-type transcriptional regulator/antitoxin HigA